MQTVIKHMLTVFVVWDFLQVMAEPRRDRVLIGISK